MGDNLINSVTTIGVSIVGIAVIAVLVSDRSNTANVMTSAGNAFAGAIKAATGPVTGSSFSLPSLNNNMLSGYNLG